MKNSSVLRVTSRGRCGAKDWAGGSVSLSFKTKYKSVVYCVFLMCDPTHKHDAHRLPVPFFLWKHSRIQSTQIRVSTEPKRLRIISEHTGKRAR